MTLLDACSFTVGQLLAKRAEIDTLIESLGGTMIVINQARAAMRQLNVDPDRKYTPRAPQQAVFQAVFRYLRDTHGLAWAEIGDAFKREQNNVSVAAKKATPEMMKRLTDVMNGVKRCPHCQGVL